MSDSSIWLKKARTFVKKTSGKLAVYSLLKGLQVTSLIKPELAAAKAEALFITPQRLRLTSRQAKVLARASQGSVQVGHDLLRVWRWGSGPGVLLVHGWSGRGAQFADWVDQLVEAGYQVTLFDAPGHGDSEGSTSSVVQLVRSIEEINKHYGPFEVVIGHSLGGLASLAAVVRDLGAIFRRAFQDIMGLDPSINPLIQRRLEQRYDVRMNDLDPEALAPKVVDNWLMLHDLDDLEIPWTEAESLARLSPGARLISTKGLGHYRILRDAEVRGRVLAFLRGEDPEPLKSPQMEKLLGKV